MSDSPAPSPMVQGPLASNLLRIALPALGSSLLMTLNSFASRTFLGHLPNPAAVLAAQAVCMEVVTALMAALTGIAVGTGAIVGRALGAQNVDQARVGARQSLVLALLASVVVALPLIVLRGPILQGLGLRGLALSLGSDYLLWLSLGLPSLFSLVLFNGLFNLMGETRRGFLVLLIAVAVNVAAVSLLIPGYSGFPRMGLSGAAVALWISQTAGTVAFVLFLPRTPLRGMLAGSWIPNFAWGERVLKVSLPAVGRQLLGNVGMLSIQAMLLRTAAHEAAGAAYASGMLIEAFSSLPGTAFAGAAAAFVGQNLGAGKPERARAAAALAGRYAIGVMTTVGVLFALAAPPLAGFLVGRQPEGESVRELMVSYLRVSAFVQPFLAIQLVLSSALNGAGETKTPRTITAITVVVRVALVWVVLDLLRAGPSTAWWAIAVPTFLASMLTLRAFRSGTWLKTAV